MSVILLSPTSANIPAPDGAWPGVQKVKSEAAAPTPYFYQLRYPGTVYTWVMWTFIMPMNYGADPTVKVLYKMASATSGDVVMDARIAAVTDGDSQDVDAKGFDSENLGSATVPDTAGHLGEVEIPLANVDSLAPRDWLTIALARNGASEDDTANGDMEVVAVSLHYAASTPA